MMMTAPDTDMRRALRGRLRKTFVPIEAIGCPVDAAIAALLGKIEQSGVTRRDKSAS